MARRLQQAEEEEGGGQEGGEGGGGRGGAGEGGGRGGKSVVVSASTVLDLDSSEYEREGLMATNAAREAWREATPPPLPLAAVADTAQAPSAVMAVVAVGGAVLRQWEALVQIEAVLTGADGEGVYEAMEAIGRTVGEGGGGSAVAVGVESAAELYRGKRRSRLPRGGAEVLCSVDTVVDIATSVQAIATCLPPSGGEGGGGVIGPARVAFAVASLCTTISMGVWHVAGEVKG